MLRIPFTQLHFEPMDPALGWLQFLDSCAKSIGVCKVMFQYREPLMQGDEFLFLEGQCLLRVFKCGLGLLDFLCLRGDRGFAVAGAREECGLSRFQCRQPLSCRSQFFLQRLDAFVASGEFLLGGLVERLRCDHLTFENLHRRDFDFQLMLHLFQGLVFEAECGGDVHELLCEWASG